MVTRIVVEKGRAVGVEIVDKPGGQPTILRAEREVIVSSRRDRLAEAAAAVRHRSGRSSEVGRRRAGARSARRRLATCRTISTCSSSAECTGDLTYDNYAKPHRTVWAGLQYLLFKKGPVASSLFETGGFWYADPTAASPDIQFHLGLGSGIEAGVEKLKNAGVTLNSAFLRPRSRGTVRLTEQRPGGPRR